jgi:hypothetical protein
MRIQRRGFLAATVGTLASVNPLGATELPSRSRFLQATLPEHVKQIGTYFVVRDSEGRRTRIELISATEGPHPMPSGIRRPISLLFRCRSGDALKQDVFEIDHPVLGRQRQLLFVPVSHRGDRMETVIG